jgi:hypothetical protein
MLVEVDNMDGLMHAQPSTSTPVYTLGKGGLEYTKHC